MAAQPDGEPVPLVLAVVGVQDAAVRPAQNRARRRRHGHRHARPAGNVRPKRKRAGNGSVRGKRLHGRRRAGRRERRDRHAGQVIADVPRVDGDHTVKRPRDAVDSERLFPSVGVGLRHDDAAVFEVAVSPPADRVGHFQLVFAVQFFADLTRQRVGQRAKPLRCVGGGTRPKKYRRHSLHHLGTIFTDVNPL